MFPRGPDASGGILMISRIEGEGALPTQQIEVAPGHSVSGLKIYLLYGSGVISGQVKVEGGALPSDAMLFVRANRGSEPLPYTAQVDSRGRFLIKGIAPGTYDVMLQVISFGGASFPPGIPRQQKQTVTVSDGAETEVVFTLDLARKDGP